MRRNALIALLMSMSMSFAAGPLQAADLRVDELVKDLRDGTSEQRWQAARLLETLGPQARPAAVYLTIALRDENWTVRYYAARALASIGPTVGDIAGANLLHVAHNDPNSSVRAEAAAALSVVDPTPLFLKVPWLYANLGGKPQDVMSEFRVRRYKPIDELVTQLQHKDAAQRRDAATLLARLRWRAAPAATALTAALRDTDETVRFFAAQALKEIGPSAYLISKETLLQVAAKDPVKRVREQAEQTLQSFLDSPVADNATNEFIGKDLLSVTRSSLRRSLLPPHDRLTMQVISPDLSERRAATWELARLRRTDHLTQRYLCKALIDDDKIVRYNAVTALGRIGLAAGPLAVSSLDVIRLGESSQLVLRRALLVKFLVDPDFAVAASAKDGSNRTETKPAVKKEPADLPPLLKSRVLNSWLIRFHDTDHGKQIRAIRELGKLGARGKDQLPLLAAFLSHPNPYVRMYTVETIGMIGFKGGSSVRYQLAEMADHEPHEIVREMAIEALHLNLDADVIASLREPGPPALPTPIPTPSAPVSPPLSDKNIASLKQMLEQETQRETSLAILSARLQPAKRGAFFVPMAMSTDRAVREIGMQALWDYASPTEVAAPLAYAIHHNMGTTHQVEFIDRINMDQSYGPYLIPYAARSARPRIRQAGLRAWSRIASQGDWRKILILPWKNHDDIPHRQAIAAVNALQQEDVVVRAFMAGGLTQRDQSTLLKYAVTVADANGTKEQSHDRLMSIYRAEKSVIARRAIMQQLANEKPADKSPLPNLFVAVLASEPESSIRDLTVTALRRYGSQASHALPALLAKLQQETSTASRMKIVETIKVIGSDNAELQAIVIHLEESLRIQLTREMLQEVTTEQAKLIEATRRRQKRNLLRLLTN